MRPQQTRLGTALAATILERGPITFADYMAIALYHPDGGYYTTGATRQGFGGDYLTSGDLSALFGAALGRQIGEIWERFGRPTPFVVREDGAGRGWLPRDVFAWARASEDAPAGFAAALRWRLREALPGGRAQREWLAEPDLPDDGRPPAMIISNELLDALPAHRVVRTAAGLAEIMVDAADDPPALVERLAAPSSPAVAEYLDRFGVPWARFPLGWRAEITLAAEEWIAAAAADLAPRGVILTIDYGDTARRLYTPERRLGTLLCYHQHQTNDRPLDATGEQDITAHVNFTAVIAAGRAHGLRLAGLTTQRDFLLRLGIRADAEALGQRRHPLAFTARHTDDGQRDYLRLASLRHRVAALTDPHGLGGFRVLLQQRGLPGARGLSGLRKPDRA